MFKASTARSPVQLTAYTGFRGRSTSSRTVQPQASKDKYNPPPRPAIEDTMGTLSFAQPVTQTLPQRTVDPAMSGFPQPGSLCSPRATPGSRGPAASSSGGPAFRPRLAGSRWPVHSSLPPARLAARPHRVASVRNSPARPFPLVHTKRRWLLPRPPRCYPHAAAYWCRKRLLGTRHVPRRHSRRRGRAKMTSHDPGAARRGEAEDEGDRLAEGRKGRSSCSNTEARGSQHSCVRLRGTRSRAQAWVPVTMETVSPGKIGCFLDCLKCKSKPFHLRSSRYQLLISWVCHSTGALLKESH